jgi:formylmethanofuran dehydrogenase subunit E
MSKFKIDDDLGSSALSPGSTKRRWEPESGIKKHNERIHRESRHADEFKNLPFKFSKPKKSGMQQYVSCDKCGHTISASVNTVGIICSECKAYVSVSVKGVV